MSEHPRSCSLSNQSDITDDAVLGAASAAYLGVYDNSTALMDSARVRNESRRAIDFLASSLTAALADRERLADERDTYRRAWNRSDAACERLQAQVERMTGTAITLETVVAENERLREELLVVRGQYDDPAYIRVPRVMLEARSVAVPTETDAQYATRLLRKFGGGE